MQRLVAIGCAIMALCAASAHAQAARTGPIPVDIVADAYMPAAACMADGVGGQPTDMPSFEIATKLVEQCSVEFNRVTVGFMRDGWSAQAAGDAEAQAKAHARDTLIPFLDENKQEVRAEADQYRAAKMTFARDVFDSGVHCATKTAVDYKELSQGTERMFVQFLLKECKPEAEVRAALSAGIDGDELIDLSAPIQLCAMLHALNNLGYLKEAASKEHYRDKCSTALSAIGRDVPN